jgi:hypothetical protein
VENTVSLMNMDDTWDGWLITENSIKTWFNIGDKCGMSPFYETSSCPWDVCIVQYIIFNMLKKIIDISHDCIFILYMSKSGLRMLMVDGYDPWSFGKYLVIETTKGCCSIPSFGLRDQRDQRKKQDGTWDEQQADRDFSVEDDREKPWINILIIINTHFE